MGLLAAWSLAWLIPAGGVIIALYLLKMRRVDVPVPTTLLWRRVTADMQANRPWQKLRPTWLLALQILAAALLACAAARPFVRATGVRGQDLVVILDNSASMAATDVRPSRLEQAKNRALRLARSLGRGDKMLVIAASSRTRAVSSLTSDKAALTEAIRSVRQTALPSMMTDALALAAAGRRGGRPLKVYVFSDGSFEPPPRDAVRGIRPVLVPVGRGTRNCAITMFRVETVGGGQQAAFVRLSNLGESSVSVTFTLTLDGSVLDARRLTLKADESRGLTVQLPARAAGLVEARLEPGDALPADDTARGFAGGGRRRVLLVGPGNVFLEQALAVDGRLEVSRAATAPAVSELDGFDVVIWDRVSPDRPSRANEWYIAAESPGSPAALGLRRDAAAVLWKHGASLARAADLSEMRYAGFRALEPRPWAQPVAEAGGAPIIVTGESRGRRSVSMGWDFLDSDLPLRVTFPILVANVLDWLAGSDETAGSYAPGEVVRFSRVRGTGPLTVTTPDGRTVRLPPDAREFTQTESQGLYSWSGGGQSGRFAVNLTSARQSSLECEQKRLSQEFRVERPGALPRTNREVYGPLLLGLLAVLSVEWLVFHRRI